MEKPPAKRNDGGDAAAVKVRHLCCHGTKRTRRKLSTALGPGYPLAVQYKVDENAIDVKGVVPCL